MTNIEHLREQNPDLYDKLLELVVNMHTLPRRERRKVQREITAKIKQHGSTKTPTQDE
jgi:hypothetical protein